MSDGGVPLYEAQAVSRRCDAIIDDASFPRSVPPFLAARPPRYRHSHFCWQAVVPLVLPLRHEFACGPLSL